MALTGHLSDLSLSELIEFFCNQRKTGRLKVLYPKGAGYFFLQTGSVVDAQIGEMRGIEAVYYALTLPNAKFEFSGSTEGSDRTINQPWTQVVLEGLRRLDEGIVPAEAFPVGYTSDEDEEVEAATPATQVDGDHHQDRPGFFAFINTRPSSHSKRLIFGALVVAVLASVAVIGFPAGWYRQSKVAVNQTVTPTPSEPAASVNEPVNAGTTEASKNNEAELAARRQRERERTKAREEKLATASQAAGRDRPAPAASSEPAETAARPGPRRVAVTVTYDESGRVTQASGGDATALRIARQKRFPPGKAGSATITIPIN